MQGLHYEAMRSEYHIYVSLTLSDHASYMSPGVQGKLTDSLHLLNMSV
jgi:hypothetical protein